MKFYDVDVRGKTLVERRSSAPSAEAGRLYYNTTDESVYYSNTSGSQVMWTQNNVDDLVTCMNSCGGVDADTLGSYSSACYRDGNFLNAGSVGVNRGGTNATTASGARTNLGLTGTSNTTHYHDGRYYTETESNNCYGRFNQTNLWTACQCVCANAGGYAVVACNRYSTGAGLYARGCTAMMACGIDRGICVCSTASLGWGISARVSAATAIIGRSFYNNSAYAGVCGCNTCNGAAVRGNTAYCNSSSRYLKHLNNICISKCLKCKPLQVYKYYWEDTNQAGFNQTIGPTAEEFHETFHMHHSMDADEYKGVYSVDGIALGLGIENLNEIETLKKIVVKLYSCIQKLEQN